VVSPRYTQRPFPPYSYVPGQSPHPVSDPAGHMFGQEMPKPPPLDPANWRASETYLYSIDLFNHGYYWEAHETWESLWHAAGRAGQIADFLKGLIKLAAAGVKMREGNVDGVRRHMKRAAELLTSVSSTTRFCGLDLPQLLEKCHSEVRRGIWPDIVLTTD
jgi:predicted metal-dependent hydrolase